MNAKNNNVDNIEKKEYPNMHVSIDINPINVN